MSDENPSCPTCGNTMEEVPVSSEKMNWFCRECAPPCVINSPAIDGSDEGFA